MVLTSVLTCITFVYKRGFAKMIDFERSLAVRPRESASLFLK